MGRPEHLRGPPLPWLPAAHRPGAPDRQQLGAYRRWLPGKLHTQRKTFVIETDRHVLGVTADEKSMTTHAEEALAILRSREAA
jgi:peroxiredoxin Q/BCP